MFNWGAKTEPHDKNKRNALLIDPSGGNPFPGRPATATPDNPPPKLFGRDLEQNELIEYFRITSEDERPLVIIQGETGMGKSALTSYMFNKIRNDNLDNEEQMIFGSFVEAYGDVKDFELKNFLLQILRSMEKYGQLAKLTGNLVQFMGKIVFEQNREYFREQFHDWDPYEPYQLITKRLNKMEFGEGFVQSFMEALPYFYPMFKEKWEAIDPNLIEILLKSQAATKDRMDALNAIRKGNQFSNFSIKTDAEALEVLHSLISLLRTFKINSILVLFIDQLEELFDHTSSHPISNKFFSLLLALRQVPTICLILSRNLQSYNNLTQHLDEDKKDQLEQWHTYLPIHRLDQDQVGQIVYFLINEFWRNLDLTTDMNFPYYPFSADTVKYLYQKHDRNLRKTLIGLHEIFENFKFAQEVKDLSDPISAIGELSIIHDPLQLPHQIQEDFKDHLLSDRMQDLDRSRVPELAIHNLIAVIREKETYISELSMSPKMPKTGKKPDVYYKLGGNLFHADQRRIGIEVKCYRSGELVKRGDVDKTTIMLKEGDLDYIVWITNVPLHDDAINSIPSELKERQIRITPQTPEEMAYTYWASKFEAALSRKPTLHEAKQLLMKIGIPELFISNPQQLIETEQLRDAKKPTSQPLTPNDSIQGQLPDDFYEEPPSLIGLDLQNKMKQYIENEVDNLIKAGRKRVNKSKLYESFLIKEELMAKNVPEHEFVETVDQLARTNGKMKATQKMINLIY